MNQLAPSSHGHTFNLRPSLEWASNPGDRLSAHPFAAVTYPRKFLFGEDETIDDQLQIGACTANMIDGVEFFIMEWIFKNTPISPFHLSRLWQYWQERNFEGTTGSDAGATIADTIRVARDLGVFPEAQYPYNIAQFTTQPPASLLNMAAQNKLIAASMLQTDVTTSKQWMFNGDGSNPLPIAYGFAVYPQFESVGRDGIITMPSGSALGGHANSKWGWDDDKVIPGAPGPGAWRIHNVWGSGWGDAGKGWISYYYPLWDHWGVTAKVVPSPIPVPPAPPSPTPTPPGPTYAQGYAAAKAKALVVVGAI